MPGVQPTRSGMAAEASIGKHPAHGFFLERQAWVHERFVAAVHVAQGDGEFGETCDPHEVAAILMAAADGVGLAAPHRVRSVVKTTHAWLIVLSAGMGGLLLMAADLGARWLIAPQELPVGVLTAVLGGSYLLWLMHRRSARMSV